MKKKTTLTLADATRDRLQAIAALRGCSWSVVVDELAEIAAEVIAKERS